MVPPPDNTGDEFPDFENMSFEEQMAWLESLAKRQGAGEDQLTTAADLDIPLPVDAEIDEPGYIPFEGSRSAREMRESSGARSPIEHQADTGIQRSVRDEPAEPSDDSSDQDPMRWLDSLSAQPEPTSGDPEHGYFGGRSEDAEAAFAALDDLSDLEADDLFEQFDASEDMEEEAEGDAARTIQRTSYQEVRAPASDDPLGGMDPMLWLESLAARQGADLSELTTSADLEIADVSPDAVIDEPGYVPFEGSRSAREAAQAAQTGQSFETGEEHARSIEHAEEAGADFGEDDFVSGTADLGEALESDDYLQELFADVEDDDESMAWLDTLAERQGTRDEELLAEADADVPDIPPDAFVDEPGYVDYSPPSMLPHDTADVLAGRDDEFTGFAEFEDDLPDEGLSWLADLAAEPDEDVADFLAFDDDAPEDYADVQSIHGDFASDAETTAATDNYLLAGMSDDDIAAAQAQGTLTPEQELAWLKRQARALAETRDAEPALEDESEVPPAVPGEIPDWLEDMRKTSEQELFLAADAVLHDSEVADVEVPDWLQEADEAFALDEQQEDDFVEVVLDGDVESLWIDDLSEHAEPELDQLIPDSELVAFISGDFVPTEPDALAEALDEEYERLQSGDDTEPEWYTAAVAKIADDVPESAQAGIDLSDEPSDDRMLVEAEAVDAPGWLADEVEEEAGVVSGVMETDMPDWLRDTSEVVLDGDRAELPDWLGEDNEADLSVDSGTVPAWLSGFDDILSDERPADFPLEVRDVEIDEAEELAFVDEDEAAIVTANLEPEFDYAVSEVHIPAGARFAEYGERLATDPADHRSRLALARALRESADLDTRLDHYEVLIESEQFLPDVSDDLVDMGSEVLERPRVQRLLGDAFMRRGLLAEALRAYRNALHRL